ncbi:elongator complex protein 1-like [Clytia hemisphaerica]|uniref:elongator complex protein 1-like n=1 Tax=Clytia hemisphaerica TaxID=252671 RepID=UPI0034D4BE49
MTRDFDSINEFPIHSDDFGEAQQVNVGWGKKHNFMAQREKRLLKSRKLIQVHLCCLLMTDALRSLGVEMANTFLFQVSILLQILDAFAFSTMKGFFRRRTKRLKDWNSVLDGERQGTCSQQKPNKHDVIFFEKNGLQHGEFTLSSKPNDKLIKQILWNPNSDILTLLIQDLSRNGTFSVQLWTTGNYHWYLKQELTFNEQPPSLSWDPENAYKLHIISHDGEYQQFVYIYDVIQSKGDDENLAMVAVIDGSQLLLTPFRQMVLPPPMAAHTISLDACINQSAFGVTS